MLVDACWSRPRATSPTRANIGAGTGEHAPAGQWVRDVGRLGEGGMAEVWLARDAGGTQWALKVLRLPDERLADRMRAEGALQGALSHPNVVPVVGVHEDPTGRPVLQMPYVVGPSSSSCCVPKH